MYAKDISFALMMMDISAGRLVVAAGRGSGALTTALAFMVGPTGQITSYEDVQRLLDMYYEQRGWDSNGLPTPATLEKLNLAKIAS